MTTHRTSSDASAGRLLKARRLVVKIGSALLVDGKRNEIRRAWLRALVLDLLACRERKQDVIVVSSGAVALGRRVLGLAPSGPLKLDEHQAAAACGQVRLAHAWQEELARHGLGAAQVLLTPGETEEWKPYLNVRATLRNLLSLHVVPIINENDTVTTPLRRFGDNDRLSARVAAMIEADALALLSDIDGLYTADPGLDPAATFIPEVHAVTPAIAAMGGESRSGFGRGGMATKIEAGRIALKAGCAMMIARGDARRPLQAVIKGARCTWFVPNCTPAAARKLWIAGTLDPRGSLCIDAGAVRALTRGGSLLPVGIIEVKGAFARGEPVSVVSPEGQEIARGLAAYGADHARRLMGKHSDEFEAILGYPALDEMIHRDDLAMLA